MKADIEALWPVTLDDRSLSYAELRSHMETALRDAGVTPERFSHVGFVVEDLGSAQRRLAQEVSEKWSTVAPEWGEAFGCHISRRVEDGVEYELIQPERESFLKRHLDQLGAGVQHLSFTVGDIGAALESLREAGAGMADPDVHDGLHGRVAFVRPAGLEPFCLELCEPRGSH